MPVPEGTTPQTLTQRGTSSLLDFVEGTVRQGLGDALGAARDLPGFVAGPTPATASFLPLYGITRQACRTYARGGGPQNLPGFDSAWGGICSPYLEDIGENPDGGGVGPPFIGGQCPVNYRVTYTIQNAGVSCGEQPPPSTNTTGNRLGPIRGFTTANGVTGGANICPGFTAENQVLLFGNNQSEVLGGSVFGSRLISASVVRSDSQPDNCGNVPAVYTPPTIAPGLPALEPSPVDFPGIGPVDIDVTFGPDGEIIIGLPDLGLEVNVGNPFEDEGEPSPTPVAPPGFQGEPGEDIDVSPGDAADETSDSNLVGVLVQTIATPPRSNLIFNPTEAYTKGGYFVYFGGNGGLALNPDGAITRQDQFFYAPEGCNRFRVVPNGGFTLRVTPYYKAE